MELAALGLDASPGAARAPGVLVRLVASWRSSALASAAGPSGARDGAPSAEASAQAAAAEPAAEARARPRFGRARRVRGARQDYLVPRAQAADDDRRAVARQPRRDALAHVLAVPHDGHRAGRDRSRRDVEAFGLLDDDFGRGAHAGFQTRFRLVELEGDVVADHPAVARRQRVDAENVRRDFATAESFDRHSRRLSDPHVADFG